MFEKRVIWKFRSFMSTRVLFNISITNFNDIIIIIFIIIPSLIIHNIGNKIHSSSYLFLHLQLTFVNEYWRISNFIYSPCFSNLLNNFESLFAITVSCTLPVIHESVSSTKMLFIFLTLLCLIFLFSFLLNILIQVL